MQRGVRPPIVWDGHTHFGMALANLVGFDLAPRLAGMNKRKLYLPRGLDVPASLRPIVSETVTTSAITRDGTRSSE